MCVHRQGTTRLPLDGFSLNSVVKFTKICLKIQIWLKADQQQAFGMNTNVHLCRMVTSLTIFWLPCVPSYRRHKYRCGAEEIAERRTWHTIAEQGSSTAMDRINARVGVEIKKMKRQWSMAWSSAWTVGQFVIRQEGGRCIEFCVTAASGWSFVTKLDDVFRNLDFEVEVSCWSDILICLVGLLSLTADSSLVHQTMSVFCQIPLSSQCIPHPTAPLFALSHRPLTVSLQTASGNTED